MKYDWVKLEREFTCYAKFATVSLREFARLKGIPYGANFKEHTANWLEKRGSKQSQKSTKIEAVLEANEISREVAAAERHNYIWGRFLDLVQNCFEEPKNMTLVAGVDTINKALKNLADVTDKATKGQRLALGMDKGTGTANENEDVTAIESLLGELSKRGIEGDEE